MITTFYPPHNFGGDGIFVERLSSELARRGHHVEVIHCVDAYLAMGGKAVTKPYKEHPNVTVHRLKSVFGLLSPLASQQTGHPIFKSRRIRDVLARGFDVIHYHNISLVGGPKVYTYGQGIKLHTLHEFWLVCPTHVLYRFNRAPCVKPDCIRCTLIHKRPPQLWRYSQLLEKSVKHVDALIAPSRFIKELHHERGLNVPIVHLPNFVPRTEPSSGTGGELTGEEPHNPYFLFVGRLEKIKGLQRVIPVFRRFPGAQLLIAGSGPYGPQLRELADGSRNIQFLGHVDQSRLQSLYRGATAVIMPSLCHEVFPTVILEAFVQKTPAIVNNLGGMPGTIEESGGGLVYRTDEEMVAAVHRLTTDSSYARELGLRGYLTYQQKWTPDAHIERYLGLIDEIAATRSQPVSNGP